MKRFLTYLLLLLFSFQTFETAFIIFNFEIHRDYFAAICINKDKPEMHCNGKCQLKKQIQKQEQQEKKKEKVSLAKENPDYLLESIQIIPDNTSKTINSKNSHYRFTYQSLIIFDVFHPPKSSHLTIS